MSLENMDYGKIGAFISAKRKEKNLTQMQLAELLGVTDRAVSKWERGKSFPDVSMLKPLCAVLEISVAELLEGEEDRREHLTKEDADDAAIKGIRTYAAKWRKKETLYFAVMVVLTLLAVLAVVFHWNQKQPVDFEKGGFSIDSAEIHYADGSMKKFSFDEDENEQTRARIKEILQENYRMEKVDQLDAEFQNAFIKFEGIGTFYADGYFDQGSKEYYTGPQDTYQKLWSLLSDYEKQQDYVFDRPLDYKIKGRSLTLKEALKEKQEELILDYYLEILKETRFAEYPDSYVKRIDILSVDKLRTEDLKSDKFFEGNEIQKEIDYYEIYDYGVYEVICDEEFTEEMRKLGPQYPEGVRKTYFLIGKKKVGDVLIPYEICYVSVPQKVR